jgi:hypothetical protein
LLSRRRSRTIPRTKAAAGMRKRNAASTAQE